MWERRGIYRVLVRNPEGKTPLGRPRRKHVEENSATNVLLMNKKLCVNVG